MSETTTVNGTVNRIAAEAATKKRKAVKPKPDSVELNILPPKFETLECTIIGTAILSVNRFGNKAKNAMIETQAAGSTNKAKKKRDPKDPRECMEGCLYTSTDGWHGVPAMTFKHGIVGACRVANYVMTRAKMAVPYIHADGFDAEDGTPLVRIEPAADDVGAPTMRSDWVRNSSGVTDIRHRPQWKPGWTMTVRIEYDADMLTGEDVLNLLIRCGRQGGIMEGRPASSQSCGMGWGLFRIDPLSVLIHKTETA